MSEATQALRSKIRQGKRVQRKSTNDHNSSRLQKCGGSSIDPRRSSPFSKGCSWIDCGVVAA